MTNGRVVSLTRFAGYSMKADFLVKEKDGIYPALTPLRGSSEIYLKDFPETSLEWDSS